MSIYVSLGPCMHDTVGYISLNYSHTSSRLKTNQLSNFIVRIFLKNFYFLKKISLFSFGKIEIP
jgi:hypothetical protein